MGITIPIKLYLEKQAVGQICPPGGSLPTSFLGLSGEHQVRSSERGQSGDFEAQVPRQSMAKHVCQRSTPPLMEPKETPPGGLLGKTLGMLPNTEEGSR